MEKFINIIFILLVSANGSAKADGHHDCHGKDCIIVDLAIKILESDFDRDLCHAFEDVDCNHHVLPNDEKICGSDGHTYINHCFFAKARCDRIMNKHNYHDHQLINPLLVAAHGPCGASTPVSTLTSRNTATVPGKPDHDCHEKDCVIVNFAIQNIGSNFNHDICKAFDDVDCASHVLTNDEQICGTDGHTYNNHCFFAKARCDIILDKHNYHDHLLINPLLIASRGPCGASTTHTTAKTTTTTTTTKLTSALTRTTSSTTSSGNIVSATTAVVSTTAAHISTKPVTVLTSTALASATSAFSTTVPSSTVSTLRILGSVFCQYRGSIDCGTAFDVICGSDGDFYPNMCELLRMQCVDVTLRQVSDASHCSLSP